MDEVEGRIAEIEGRAAGPMIRLVVQYSGPQSDITDHTIARALGRSAISSGFNFASDTRDLEYAMDTEEQAHWLRKKLRRAVPHLIATICVFDPPSANAPPTGQTT